MSKIERVVVDNTINLKMLSKETLLRIKDELALGIDHDPQAPRRNDQ